MKKILFLTLITLSIIPALSFAQTTEPPKLDYSRLVQCDGVVDKNNPEEKLRNNECDFADLLYTIRYIINWLFIITIPIATVLLAYGGLLYLTGTQNNIGTAKKIFQSIAKGFIIMLVAWFGVITVVNWFIDENDKKIINTFVNVEK